MCLALGGGGVADILQIDDMKESMETLGYPLYLLTLLGVLKIAGVVTVLGIVLVSYFLRPDSRKLGGE